MTRVGKGMEERWIHGAGHNRSRPGDAAGGNFMASETGSETTMRVFRRSKFQRHIVVPLMLTCFLSSCYLAAGLAGTVLVAAFLIIFPHSFSR